MQLLHSIGDFGPTVLGDFGETEGVVEHWVADEPGEQRALFGRELVGLDAVVLLGRRLDAVGAVAEVHGVEVALEDLLLRHLRLESHREHCLLELSVHVLLRRQQRVLHQLLGDRGAALTDAAGRDVGGERPPQGAEVDTAVLVEAVVLDVEHGLDDRGGHVVELDRHAPRVIGRGGGTRLGGGRSHDGEEGRIKAMRVDPLDSLLRPR